MTFTDYIGFVGVMMMLSAYLLNLLGKYSQESLGYILLNLIGATLACLASIFLKYIPFIILEGVWTAASLVALIKYYKSHNVSF